VNPTKNKNEYTTICRSGEWQWFEKYFVHFGRGRG